MRGSLPLGKLFGIPFRINYSWFAIFALLTFTLSQVLPPKELQLSPLQAWGLGIVTSLLFFASVVSHELAHSLVARASGIPVRSITLFILGGVSHLGREATRPVVELAMAFIGPLTSLVLGAALLWGLAPATRSSAPLVMVVAQWLGSINILLGLFNLIPGFPLDGGRVLRALLWMGTGDMPRATTVASWIGRGVGYLFILGGLYFIFRGEVIGGMWFAFIGWFLENAASTSQRQLQAQLALQGLTAGSLVSRNFVTVPSHLTVDELVRNYLLPINPLAVLVARMDNVVGVFTHKVLHRVPRTTWPTVPLAQVMTPLARTPTVPPSAPASELLGLLSEGEALVLVMEGRQVLGIVDWEGLSRFIRIRSTTLR
ncbi:MAG: site-2 protease family protein [Chloroflexi bacterium]|nr:site-2 protease family protein [Chloroflexota bacterium]